jgi:hypothetical protein
MLPSHPHLFPFLVLLLCLAPAAQSQAIEQPTLDAVNEAMKDLFGQSFNLTNN